MTNEAQIVIRIPRVVANELAEYIESLSERAGGVPISQAAALRQLIIDGLDRAGFHVPIDKPKKTMKKSPASRKGAK